jgi:hypothetical protein
VIYTNLIASEELLLSKEIGELGEVNRDALHIILKRFLAPVRAIADGDECIAQIHHLICDNIHLGACIFRLSTYDEPKERERANTLEIRERARRSLLTESHTKQNITSTRPTANK